VQGGDVLTGNRLTPFQPFKNRKRVVVFLIFVILGLSLFYIASVQREARREKADIALRKGTSLYEKGDFDKALLSLEEAVKLNPANEKARLLLAQTYEARGNLEKAIVEYQEYIELEPEDYAAHYNLAIIYKYQGKKKKAISELEKALKYNANFAAAYLELARLYKETNQIDKAISTYKALINLKPFGLDLEELRKELRALEAQRGTF
jgi:tetratricopeptide (TPR) repeat protein